MSREFRDCVGSFATGVTIVAAEAGGRRAGMTLNAFTSVSLDPLLVCVSLAHGTRTLELVRAGGRFAVSILGADQRAVALEFARPGAPFPDEHVRTDEGGWVVVRDALAVVRCTATDLHEAGDHDLAVGRVETFETAAGAPLVFHRGEFGGLARAA